MKSSKNRFNNKLNVKKGDMVVLLSGDQKYGPERKTAHRVLEVFPEKRMAIVEGINIISRHTKPNAKQTQGGIIKKEAAVHISKLALLDPKDGKPVRIGRKNDGGNSVRYSKRSNEVIK